MTQIKKAQTRNKKQSQDNHNIDTSHNKDSQAQESWDDNSHHHDSNVETRDIEARDSENENSIQIFANDAVGVNCGVEKYNDIDRNGDLATTTITPKAAATPATPSEFKSLEIQQRLEEEITRSPLSKINKSYTLTNISKLLLICVAMLYFLIGISITSTVVTHFIESKQECLHPTNERLVQHPELYLFDQCTYKTYPFKSFDFWDRSDVNCNCRQLLAELSLLNQNLSDGIETNNNTISMLDSVLKHWDMLEILRITDENAASFSINLNDSYHYNSEYLKILHLENIEVTSLGHSIDNWKYLEYFYLSHAYFIKWPDSFNALNKISFFKLENTFVSELPPNLCSITNLRAIFVQQSISSPNQISQLPDCIVELKLLHSMIFYFVEIETLPVGLFTMSSIKEIGFVYTSSITEDSMIDLINSTVAIKNEFTWNKPSETTISLTLSPLCVWYDRVYTVNEHAKLEYISLIREFLNDTNACTKVCDDSTTARFQCTPFEWQDGVCNSECDVQDCNFDGGDCSQLCQTKTQGDCYSLGLFANGICDSECNITECDYDKYECLPYTYVDIVFGYNVTYCDDDKQCPIQWVNDGWCDNYCDNIDDCYNDGQDCICNENEDELNACEQLIDTLGSFGLAQQDFQVPCQSICTLWELFTDYDWTEDTNFGDSQVEQAAFVALLELHSQMANCTIACQYLDSDDNNLVSISEFVTTFHEKFNLTTHKAAQIDCTGVEQCV